MEKFQPDPNDSDLLKERYKGTSSGIAMAGYAYASHLGSMIAGLISVGALAYFFHGHVNKYVDILRTKATTGNVGKGKSFITKLIGIKPDSHALFEQVQKLEGEAAGLLKPKLLELIKEEEKGLFQKMASGILNAEFFGWKPFGALMNRQGEEQVSAIVMGGGLGVVAGYIISTVWAVIKGGHEGSAGKKQFKRAQAEIEELRDMNDDLNQINNELHAKYREASTQFKDEAVETGKLRVSADDVPTTRRENAAPGSEKPPTTLKSESASHQGMLAAAPELAATPA